ncbi:hypothetical protein ACLKA6_015325 [Drosophila palustris]
MATACNEGFNGSDYLNDYDIYDDTMSGLFLGDQFEDQWVSKVSSIQEDVAKIAARSRTISSSFPDDFNYIDTKTEIRFSDCMWSTFGAMPTLDIMDAKLMCGSNSSSNNNNSNSNSNNNNTTNSAASSYSESIAVPPAIVSGSSLIGQIKTEIEDHDDEELPEEEEEAEAENVENCSSNNNNNNNYNKRAKYATSARITITKPKSSMQFTIKKNNNNSAEEHIPPGASLLRKSIATLNNNSNNNKQMMFNYRSSTKCLNSPQSISSCYDENTTNLTEFRHNVDLRACVMGSNNISLTSSADATCIDHISRELQNTSKNRIDMSLYVTPDHQPQIGDVLDVISQETTTTTTTGSGSGLTTFATTKMETLSDDDETTPIVVATSLSPPASNSDCDSDDGDYSTIDSRCGSSASVDGNNSIYMRHISDHSYTRSEMETNLETPSDSDEEIDVVSLNDKKLPTNPSDRDRRALQTKVANKMSTLPPPRRGRYELPYTPASSSPVKSEANSRFPSPSSTPYQSAGSAGSVSVSTTVYSPFVSRNSNSNSNSSNSSSAGSECVMQMLSKGRKRYYDNDSLYRVYSASSSSASSSASASTTIKGAGGNKPTNSHSSATGASKRSRVKKLNSQCLITSDGFKAYADLTHAKQQQPTLGANNSCNSSSSSNSSSGSNSGSSSSNNNNNSMLKRQFSLDEADTIEKRNLHNDMERQRRIGLKNLFEALKKQIPNIRDKERAPKVNILREAAKLCEQLTSEERELSLKRQLLKAKQKQQQELIARLRLSKNAAE